MGGSCADEIDGLGSVRLQPQCEDRVSARCAIERAGAWADCLRSGEPILYRGYPAAAASPLPGLAGLPAALDDAAAAIAGVVSCVSYIMRTALRLSVQKSW